jgi:hypothetical protein
MTSGRRLVVKIIAEYLSQHDEKDVVPAPLSGIGVENIRSQPIISLLSGLFMNNVTKLNILHTTVSPE